MTLQQLVYAVKIADTKSMNKAAAELYVSQPALSSTIRDLEEELNIELFIRTNRGIVITAEEMSFKLCKTDGRTESDDRRSIHK